MKREINLLPPEFQAARQRSLYSQGVGRILRRLNVGLLLVVAAFAGTHLILRQIAAGSNLAIPATPPESVVEQEVRAANELVAAVHRRLEATAAWTPLVADVLAVLPGELTLSELSVSDTAQNLTIKGVSRSQAAVVTFEQAVGALPGVATVDSPLQNFATGTETSFTLTVKRQASTP